MPAYEPVSSPFSHPFTARCSVCGSRGHPSHELATGHAPWTYIGPCCQDAATRARVQRAAVFAKAGQRAADLAAVRQMHAERAAAALET